MDYKTYAEILLEQSFEEMSLMGDVTDCEDCDHLCTTKDPFGTGDSPTEYSCEGTGFKDCLRVDQLLFAIKENF